MGNIAALSGDVNFLHIIITDSDSRYHFSNLFVDCAVSSTYEYHMHCPRVVYEFIAASSSC
jgi:hypothetical protein